MCGSISSTPGARRAGRLAIDIFGHLAFLGPALIVLLYWSWPMVRRSWAILEGPISVGGIPASFLLKSLVPAFCVLLLIQGVSALIRDLIRLRRAPMPLDLMMFAALIG
jgi:TRAP-type mannitol/chloroaromatic compound transport system permease small subunit